MSCNLSWCKRCSATTLMIMINGLVLTYAAAIYGPSISSQNVLRHHKHSNWHRSLRNLENIIIKLKNVIDRYDVRETELKVLFSGIADTGVNKSEKFRDWLPKRQRLKDFDSLKFKHRRNIKKRIHKLLLKFHNDVQSFAENFQELINFEKSPRFKKEDRSNGNRIKILNELQYDLKTLDVEIIDIIVKKNKRLNLSRRPKKRASTILSPPKSQTDLMIREWEVIEHSKEYLKHWNKTLNTVLKFKNVRRKKKVKLGHILQKTY